MLKATGRTKRLFYVLLVLIIVLTFVFIVPANRSSGSEYVLEPIKEMSEPIVDRIKGQASAGNRYEAYLSEHADAARPAMELMIEGESYAAVDGMDVATLESYEGASTPVVSTEESGAIHWDVDVPEDGLYHLSLRYFPAEGNTSPIERELLIDGSAPFEEASRLVFSRVWRNERPGLTQDARGNDLRPRQVESPQWQESVLRDAEGYYRDPFSFYLTKGQHRITLVSHREPMIIDYLKLYQQEAIPAYEQVASAYLERGYEPTNGLFIKLQGENAAFKSNPSLYPLNDRSSPGTEPYHVSKIRMNTIGGVNWKIPGQWISWEVDIPQDGLYEFGLRYKQNTVRGVNVVRELTIDGVVPFKESEAIPFPYDGVWQIGSPGENGSPYLYHLTKGKHRIKLELTMGELAEIIRMVRSSIQQLNALYLKIIMITSAAPDPLRDYELDKKIPELQAVFQEQSELLAKAADRMDEMVGGTSASTTILRTTSYQLDDLGSRTETLTSRLKSFKDNVTALGTWLLTVNEQPLEIDYLYFKSPDVAAPKASTGIVGKSVHEVMSFARSFSEDYSHISNGEQDEKSINVWIAAGRDQAQLLRSMIDNSFTPQTGIDVNLQLVSPAVVLPATLAGKGPDIALTQGDVINFALRGALQDLTAFPDFEAVRSRFKESAFTGFNYRDGVYAVPETQSFPMLFYRKDILEELKLDVPMTWDDMYRIIPELQKHNMDLALPQNIVFESMLYQNGGQYYQQDGIATDLDSDIGIETFRKWTELYTNYKLPIEFDFINRFRTGEMPIGIADYTTFNFLTIFAPEIRGQWGFVAVPGTRAKDGTVHHETMSTATGTVMFDNAKNKEAGWAFIKWWTDTEAQVTFGREMEAILGESARYAAANQEALKRLPWSAKEMKQLTDELEWVVGRPAVPGGYSLDRHLYNAFYEVYTEGSEPRETLENYVRTINQEITIKRQEFDLPTK
ncbi:extracellular solute-binding protein [Paenibacillus harenae]|uniref:extracellular solute-binding protein n=1 Tax=Paenibacillus harenae TaxID=306543 RepID=UPI002792E07F|nr:extracellular solute-binding protein [Paenibacillus harenae]MDQ0059291.1 ABC-type glycerol-3-phosphate transport system substrate-binding protein [Paenibacillus harenae]